MYKLLIADDEEIIRHGIARLVQKDAELDLVAEAEDGETALELAAEHLPDILLVDINMPFLGGLEFIEKLGDLLRDAVVIVITGYDQFAYAQKALRLNVFDYLLKPLSEGTFYESIRRAKEHLARHNKQVQYLGWARMQIDRYRPALSAEFTERWIKGYFSEPEVLDQAEKLGLFLPEGETGLSVFRLAPDNLREEADWDERTLYYAADNIAREVFAAFTPVLTARAGGGLVLVSPAAPAGEWYLTSERARRLIEEHLPVKAFLAQKTAAGWKGMPEALDAALEELELVSAAPALMREVRAYIEAHYMEPGFSLMQTAERLHVSPQYLSRVFRREFGVTFMDYITRLRIRRAAEMLSQKDWKVYEIAEQIGYSNQHYFSSAFKRVLGVSPMEYRRSLHKG